jgi:conjugative transposon TraJ protein
VNSILSPVVSGTHLMLASETLDMQTMADTKNQLETEIKRRNPETAYLVDGEAFDERLAELGILDTPEIAGMYIERAMYDAKKWMQKVFRDFLELLFHAAALIIDVIRTFFLIVLAILGPIAFAVSVYDGFGSTLVQWLTRYISVYLWLPVSDLFGCILARLQSSMIASDIARMQADPAYALDASDAVYVVFLLIGIVGFFTIPTVAGWIIQAGGMGNFGKNVNTAGAKGGAATVAGARSLSGNISGHLMRGRNSSSDSSSQPQGDNYASGNGSNGSQNKEGNSK